MHSGGRDTSRSCKRRCSSLIGITVFFSGFFAASFFFGAFFLAVVFFTADFLVAILAAGFSFGAGFLVGFLATFFVVCFGMVVVSLGEGEFGRQWHSTTANLMLEGPMAFGFTSRQNR